MKFVINIVTLALAGISSSVHARELGGGAVVSSESELNLSSCMSSTNSNTHPPFCHPLAEVLAGTADSALPQVLSDAITDADEEEFNSSGCATRSAHRAWGVEYCGWSESRRERYYAECERWKRNGSTHFEDNCCNRPAPTCEEERNSSGCATRSAHEAWKVEYCGWSESRKDRHDADCERWKRNGSTHFEDNCCNRPDPRCAGIYVYDEKDFMDEDFQYEDFQGEDFQDLFQGEDFQDEEFHDEDVQEDFDEFQFE
jgi:hypothetical protein